MNTETTRAIRALEQLTSCTSRLLYGGLEPQQALEVVNDERQRPRLINYWRSHCYDPSGEEVMAADIMGQNFFGVADAIIHFASSEKERKRMTEPNPIGYSPMRHIPYHWATLKRHRKTHMLVAIPPFLSIHDMMEKTSTRGWVIHEGDIGSDTLRYHGTKPEWILLNCGDLGLGTTFIEQSALLESKKLTLAHAYQFAYAFLGMDQKGIKCKPTDIRLRCAHDYSCPQAKHRCIGGHFFKRGEFLSTHSDFRPMKVTIEDDLHADEKLGILTIVKPDRPYKRK
jgi:hypothetical protein